MACGPRRTHADYTVGWILMLDTIHEDLPVPSTDPNTYYLGNIGDHNIAIAILPQGIYGISAATAVATHLLSTFSNIRFSLMVGIGGVPTTHADIRLGDIVVSQPENTSGGVIQYDFLKVLGNGEFKRTGMLNQPPLALLTALGRLKARHYTEKSRVSEFLDNIRVMAPEAADFAQPKEGDVLYQADYVHLDGPSKNCDNCDQSKTVSRPIRKFIEPVIHYDGRYRDRLAQDLGVYCVEMEAAGLMNHFPCLVIRGISDYADSHKNKTWQQYAAGVAAAYARELLLEVPSNQVNRTWMKKIVELEVPQTPPESRGTDP
ncbi:nucleoside phosphorylase domain-containing protein [Aspergillus tetrazonus]